MIKVLDILYTYAGGIGISIDSAIHMTILKSNDIPASTKISAIAIGNTSNVRPSSALHISSKLLSVTSSPFVSRVIPDSNAATNVENCPSKRNSSKQASISSASGHPSSTSVLSEEPSLRHTELALSLSSTQLLKSNCTPA